MKIKLPKSQSYPASLIKVGAVLYEAFAYTSENGKVESGIDAWVVRTIRARRNSLSRFGVANHAKEPNPKKVNLCQRNEITWKKGTGKNGIYAWAPNIWSGYKKQFSVGSDLPRGLYTTKRAAVRWAIADTEYLIRWLETEIKTETDPEGIQVLKAEHALISEELKVLSRRMNALAKK